MLSSSFPFFPKRRESLKSRGSMSLYAPSGVSQWSSSGESHDLAVVRSRPRFIAASVMSGSLEMKPRFYEVTALRILARSPQRER